MIFHSRVWPYHSSGDRKTFVTGIFCSIIFIHKITIERLVGDTTLLRTSSVTLIEDKLFILRSSVRLAVIFCLPGELILMAIPLQFLVINIHFNISMEFENMQISSINAE